MNPFTTGALGTILRIAIGYALGRLGGELSDSEVAEVATAIAAAATAAWGVREKLKARKKQLVGQAVNRPISEVEAEALVKSGAAPSVFTPKDEIPKLNGAK